jgi:DUF4097 and DUF4098 domain-containing protein YvlB
VIKRSAVVGLILFASTAAGAQEIPVFSGQVSQGAWLRIRNYKGDIRVTEASGSTASVVARRRYERREDGETRFEVKRDGQNVTICAITERTRRCDEEGYDARGGDDRSVGRADFTVSLPRGVRLLASTGNGEVFIQNAGADVRASSGNGEVNVAGARGAVKASSGNGDVSVDRAQGEVDAHSGNGDIRVTTSRGPVSASTGNGGIDVAMSTLTGNDDMEFSTGNGTITVAFPSNLSATIDANGSMRDFETDFPINMGRGFSGNRVRGTIGSGERRIRMSTGNGRIRLRKI